MDNKVLIDKINNIIDLLCIKQNMDIHRVMEEMEDIIKKPVQLGNKISQGGNYNVWEISNFPNYVVKISHRAIWSEDIEKNKIKFIEMKVESNQYIKTIREVQKSAIYNNIAIPTLFTTIGMMGNYESANVKYGNDEFGQIQPKVNMKIIKNEDLKLLKKKMISLGIIFTDAKIENFGFYNNNLVIIDLEEIQLRKSVNDLRRSLDVSAISENDVFFINNLFEKPIWINSNI